MQLLSFMVFSFLTFHLHNDKNVNNKTGIKAKIATKNEFFMYELRFYVLPYEWLSLQKHNNFLGLYINIPT